MEIGSLILIGFIGISVFSLIRSRKRTKTALYIFLAILGGLVCAATLGYFVKFSGYFAGEFSLDIALLCGMLVALIHSRRSRMETTPSTAQTSEGQP